MPVKKRSYFRLCMPYCIKQAPSGGYFVLNREYKPIGFNNAFTQHVEYEDYPLVHNFKITPELATKISIYKKPDLDSIFLYKDGFNPDLPKDLERYFYRLSFLCSLKSGDEELGFFKPSEKKYHL